MNSIQLRLKINTITQLCFFLVFAIAVNQIALSYLILMTALLLAVMTRIKSHHFFRLIKRLKWFFIVMFVIFLFNTPGEHIKGWMFNLSPTYEGLQTGLLQMFRILALLAMLSVIMAFNTKQQLISSFYFLASPFKCLGLEVERFAARLWLTLHYVESAQPSSKDGSLLEQLKVFGQVDTVKYENVSIQFEIPIFKVIDMVVIFALILVIVYMLIKTFT
ncbi:MAG: hypothetical protein CTY10_00310 [Methylotenera sp.]|nr:MAG: hypothetical protein CTY10_00310 [Methylotenera sp.]